jgi:HK97 family phage prohead protease
MSKERIIETADFGVSGTPQATRVASACNSAIEFHDSELVRLQDERRSLREKLMQMDNDEKYNGIQEQIDKVNAKLTALEKSWAMSSLNRRYIMTRTERANGGIPIEHIATVEKRISAMPVQQGIMTGRDIQNATVSKSNQTKLVGYAAVTDKLSQDLGGFYEKIQRGAFDKVVVNCDCRFLINHNADEILARSTNNSLRLYSDPLGLKFFADMLPDDQLSESAVSRVARGDWSQCSFCFCVGRDRWEFAAGPGEIDLRIVEEISELLDCSVVSFPAYKGTSIKVLTEPKRSIDLKRFGGFDTEAKFTADVEDDFNFFMSEKLEKQRKIERQYLHAGRILNRCKAQLQGR